MPRKAKYIRLCDFDWMSLTNRVSARPCRYCAVKACIRSADLNSTVICEGYDALTCHVCGGESEGNLTGYCAVGQTRLVVDCAGVVYSCGCGSSGRRPWRYWS